jgi:two-component system cell cycle response regulator DivK
MKIKILIVDDAETNRELTARLLQIHGYEILFAEDGLQALALTQKEQPDIVLMDIGLPMMDGWEATKIIKSTESTKHIPVIALSAHAMEETEQKALDAGCDAYVSKPLDLSILLEAINSSIKLRSPI